MNLLIRLILALILNGTFHAVMWIGYREEKKIATAAELRQYVFTWKICGIWMFLSLYSQTLTLDTP